MDLTQINWLDYGFSGACLLVLVVAGKFMADQYTRIIDNNREDIKNEREKFVASLEKVSDTFREEIEDVRSAYREEQKESRLLNTKMAEELRRVGDVLTRHEEALEKISNQLTK